MQKHCRTALAAALVWSLALTLAHGQSQPIGLAPPLTQPATQSPLMPGPSTSTPAMAAVPLAAPQAPSVSGSLLGGPSAFAAPAASRLPNTIGLADPKFMTTAHQATPAPVPPAPDDQLDELTERLEAAEDELAAMRKESKSSADKLLELLNKKPAGPELPLIRLSGFFHLDDGLFSQSPQSQAVLGDMQDGVGFRRARLQALGNLTEFTRYSVEMDFATAGRPSFMDVWGEQGNLPFFGTIRIGQFRMPETMDGLTSIRHLEFLERNLAFQALDPFRRVGIMAYRVADDEMTTLAYAVYATGFTFSNGVTTSYGTIGDNRYGTQIGDNGGVSFAIRGTHLLYYDEPAEGRYLLHVGGGYNYSQIGGNGLTGPSARAYEARAIPEFFVGDPAGGFLTANGTPPVVDTGRFLANDYQMAHVELAGNYGSAHFQTEAMVTGVDQMNGGPTVYYYGAYAQAGYLLTGESMGYNKQTGVMDYNVKPFSEFVGTGKRGFMCGWGAWEIAARWSYLNLAATNVDPVNQLPAIAGPPPAPNLGTINESTVALNWWWNQYTRVQFNWIHGMPDYNVAGFAPYDIFGTRFQIEF
jgi:phosphate-selective porin OprO/OprP